MVPFVCHGCLPGDVPYSPRLALRVGQRQSWVKCLVQEHNVAAAGSDGSSLPTQSHFTTTPGDQPFEPPAGFKSPNLSITRSACYHLRHFTLSETFLNNRISEDDVEIDDYYLYREDRPSRGGGIAMYIEDDLHREMCSDFRCCGEVEVVCVKVKTTHNKPILFVQLIGLLLLITPILIICFKC